ncbi:MAG: outer membrane lipoprotein-sorting protein [Opitutales bacterium]
MNTVNGWRVKIRAEALRCASRLHLALILLILGLPSGTHAFRPILKENKGEQILEKQRSLHGVDSEVSELRLASIDSKGNVLAREFISAFARAGSQVNGLIIFTKPETIRGAILLARHDPAENESSEPNAWMYLPALNTIREVDQNMPGQKQFFGSEFTWDDIMLESMTPQRSKWIKSTHFQDEPAELIELTPSRGPSYLRDRRELYIHSKEFNTLRVDVFSRSSELTKTLTAYDYGSPDIDGSSKRPHRLVAQNISSLETSVLTLIKARQNIEMPADTFDIQSLANLSKVEDPFRYLTEGNKEGEK